ncbi:SDR family NAD(P)-dependent oxidoreductase [Pelagicoccus mobilis]|uniref:SDR family oxidoreductase n=1 Tax=Pelagicoccus mobilis TaxID=415221 RepID=A0A934S3H7_9BACT|nr:SDR family oxidoreductase [Pelagicoccus mobilis]MBK1880515.1 SDR family oxidoreductase [Pelagicoccus mobilis]
MDKLAKKVVLITGASRGIGKAISVHLADKGATLALTSRNQANLDELQAELTDCGVSVKTYAADVTDFQEAKSIVKDCESTLGPIDVLINNAGISGPNGNVLEQDFEELWKTMEVNVRGPMAYMQAALPSMLRRNAGIVINMGSYSSVHPFPGAATYSASKAALARYTDSVQATLKGSSVQIFTVSPGLVETDMTKDAPFVKDIPKEFWSPIEAISRLVEKLAGGKYASLKGRFIHVKDDIDELAREADRINSDNLYSLTLNNLKGPVG